MSTDRFAAPGLRTLLVVEDDGLIRLDLVDMLEDMGFRVLEAANADEAIAMLERGDDIEAVLTDIDMPGSMDGLALVRMVRNRWPPCRLLVISGRYQPGEDDMPRGAGFLSKPISERKIEQKLAELGIVH